MRSCLASSDSLSKRLILASNQHGQTDNRNDGGNNPREEAENEHSKPQLPAPFLASGLAILRRIVQPIMSIRHGVATPSFLNFLSGHVHLLDSY